MRGTFVALAVAVVAGRCRHWANPAVGASIDMVSGRLMANIDGLAGVKTSWRSSRACVPVVVSFGVGFGPSVMQCIAAGWFIEDYLFLK